MKSVQEKLGVKPGKQVFLFNAPQDYSEVISTSTLEEADIVQIFVSSQKEINDFQPKLACLKKNVMLWVTYPKASNHLGINRDIVAELLRGFGLKSVAICAIDEKWSALRFKFP